MHLVATVNKTSIIKVLLGTYSTYICDGCSPDRKAQYTLSPFLLPASVSCRCWASCPWEWLRGFSPFQMWLLSLQHPVDQLFSPSWMLTLAFLLWRNAISEFVKV